MSILKDFAPEIKKKLLALGILEEELKILNVWRYISFGQITVYKKEGKLSGRIEIKTTI